MILPSRKRLSCEGECNDVSLSIPCRALSMAAQYGCNSRRDRETMQNRHYRLNFFSTVALVLLIVHFLFSNITVQPLIQTIKPMPNRKTTVNHSITKQPYNNHFHHKTTLEQLFFVHGMATEHGCHSKERDPNNKKITSLYIFSRHFFLA